VYKYRTKLRFSQIKKTITNTNGLGIERKKEILKNGKRINV
jgi:hypothetical protein